MKIGVESEESDALTSELMTLFIDASCFFPKHFHMPCWLTSDVLKLK